MIQKRERENLQNRTDSRESVTERVKELPKEQSNKIERELDTRSGQHTEWGSFLFGEYYPYQIYNSK